MSKNKVYVKINGSEYTIIGEEAEDYIFLISRFLDRKIKETLSTNPKHSNTSAAVLTALTITDELFKLRKENSELANALSEPEDKLNELAVEYEKIKEAYLDVCAEFEEYKAQTLEEKVDVETLQKAYNELYESYIKKSEEYESLLTESIQIQERSSEVEKELAEANEHLRKLKDEFLEKEIENVRMNNELKSYRETMIKRNNI